MSVIDCKELLDTLNDAETYVESLQALGRELKSAQVQIVKSSEDAIKEIEYNFNNLQVKMQKVLENRKNHLINETIKIRAQSLEPLRCSDIVISDKLKETTNFIELGKNVDQLNLDEFSRKSSLLGSLPQVPELKEVSCITFQFDAGVEQEIIDSCSSLGSVTRIAPVQINSLSEKPGAILVEWEILDSDEPYSEIQEYKLQKALGNGHKDNSIIFYDCYQGSELQYLVQDLKANQEFSFRICCKFEGCLHYSPWSIVQVGSTCIKPYSWKETANFCLANEGKISASVSNEDSLILSDGAQFCCGNSLDFTMLNVGEQLKNNFIGVAFIQDDLDLNKSKDGTFLLEATGEIYIDGSLKSTKLPPLYNGCKVTFMCVPVSDDKVRINIDVCNKRVTYDWCIEKCSAMHFLAKFSAAKWKVMVE